MILQNIIFQSLKPPILPHHYCPIIKFIEQVDLFCEFFGNVSRMQHKSGTSERNQIGARHQSPCGDRPTNPISTPHKHTNSSPLLY